MTLVFGNTLKYIFFTGHNSQSVRGPKFERAGSRKLHKIEELAARKPGDATKKKNHYNS